MKTFYLLGFVLLVFACDSSDEVLPAQNNTTGGDDEDPIIQGSVIFPNGYSEADVLVNVLEAKSGEILDFTLTDRLGEFRFTGKVRDKVILEIVCFDGTFRKSDPFEVDSIPLMVTI